MFIVKVLQTKQVSLVLGFLYIYCLLWVDTGKLVFLTFGIFCWQLSLEGGQTPSWSTNLLIIQSEAVSTALTFLTKIFINKSDGPVSLDTPTPSFPQT